MWSTVPPAGFEVIIITASFSWTCKHCTMYIYMLLVTFFQSSHVRKYERTVLQTHYCFRRDRWSRSELWPFGLERHWKWVVCVDNVVYSSNMLQRLCTVNHKPKVFHNQDCLSKYMTFLIRINPWWNIQYLPCQGGYRSLQWIDQCNLCRLGFAYSCLKVWCWLTFEILHTAAWKYDVG